MAQLKSISIIVIFCFLLPLIVLANGTLICKEDKNRYQSVKFPISKAKFKFPLSSSSSTLSPVFTTTNAHANSYKLNAVRKPFSPIYTPIITHRLSPPNQPLIVPTYIPAESQVAIESSARRPIIIPIGESHFRPVQYVDSFTYESPSRSFFESKRKGTIAESAFTTSTTAPINITTATTSASRTIDALTDKTPDHALNRNAVTASSNIDEVTLNSGSAENKDNNIAMTFGARQHPMRFIELESSYVPLTIRFPSRASKLNIMPNDNDLVGQDSNRHDNFGRSTSSLSNDEESGRSVNLDSRVIFGETKRDEPLVLREDGKTNIPSNMQRIIKCIFPDFHFDGEDKVQSAC